jgi:hypothetical protein
MKHIAGRLALVGIATMLALLLAGALLRLIGFGAPILYQPDPRLGWILRAGAEGWYASEGRGFVQVNSASCCFSCSPAILNFTPGREWRPGPVRG